MKRVLLLVAVILLVEPLAVYAQSSLLPSLPELLQKLHDLYADDYPKFTAAFSEAVKSPTKTTYGEELKTNVNMCELIAEGEEIGVKAVCAKYDIHEETYRNWRIKATQSNPESTYLPRRELRSSGRARGTA
jgi:hypothetical protein